MILQPLVAGNAIEAVDSSVKTAGAATLGSVEHSHNAVAPFVCSVSRTLCLILQTSQSQPLTVQYQILLVQVLQHEQARVSDLSSLYTA